MNRWVLFGTLGISLGMATLATANAQSLPANGVGSQFEIVFWQSVSSSDDRAQFEAYLTQYPNGTFAALARAKMSAIDRRGAPIAAVPPPAVVPVVVKAEVLSPAEIVRAVTPAPVPSPPGASLSEQLRALSKSQGLGDSKPATIAVRAQLPERPALASVTPAPLPAQFCTATARNAHYDVEFKPSVDRADQNNRTAIEHMKKLRLAYDEAAERGDAVSANVFAAEARAYEAIAKDVYDMRATYDAEFNRLMAVPIVKCQA